MDRKVICQKCIYYFVTWQASQPHGCKRFGFKSKLIPSIAVKRSSGEDCKYFNRKENI